MDAEFIEFQDFVEDFFNLELELEIDRELVNAEEVILEGVDESEVVDEVFFLSKLDIAVGKIYIYEYPNKISKIFFKVCKIFEISRFSI